MIVKEYQKYLVSIFLKNFFIISFIFLCIGLIINIFEEIKFFEKYQAGLFYPIYLSVLNSPSLLFDIFPFIFLISAKFFFINLHDKKELEIFKTNGVSNFNILSIVSILTLLIAVFLLIFFYSMSSKFKSTYLDIKNNFSNNNEYLAVVNDNGLWIKEEIKDKIFIINAEKFEENLLRNLTISESNKNFEGNKTLIASTANIREKKWILNNVKILSSEGLNKKLDSYFHISTFNGEIISNLFSNLNSLNIIQLHKLSENYSKIGYSTTDVKIHINRIYSMPLFYILMTVLGYLIMQKMNFINSKFFTIIIGILISVLVYYLNYFSNLLGTKEILPIYISVWMPHLILFLICNIGIIRVNEN